MLVTEYGLELSNNFKLTILDYMLLLFINTIYKKKIALFRINPCPLDIRLHIYRPSQNKNSFCCMV